MQSTAQSELIKEMLKTPGVSPSRVARQLGIDIKSVLEVIDPPDFSQRQYKKIEIGPEWCRKYAIAIKDVLAIWPEADYLRIEQARTDYDAGYIEMIQLRVEDKFILYAIPRKTRVRRRPYFNAPAEQ